MTDHVAICPFCNVPVEISKESLNQIVICPNCKEEICFSEEDLVDAERARTVLEKAKIAAERARVEYRFLILELDNVEYTLNRLWRDEGWQVVSQSTVFLSESSLGVGGFSGSTRKEGIAFTLKREI